jgi:tetratricopeptide (TPR) repeat protein
MSKSGNVQAREELITITTYERGPEDRNPSLLMGRRNPIHPGSSIVYPYPLQETLFPRKTDKQWRAFTLENDFLRLTLLPELGGRLFYVFDKAAGQEAIYHNQVLKWARIGIRGAWVSGGIEWNFPNGHTVTSSSPVDCTIRENGDGSVSLLFGDIELISRMRWSVALTLHPDRACFQTEMRLNNRTALPNRFWFWANSAAPVSEGMEFLSSATKVMTLKDVMAFPVNDGVDISWDKNHVEAQDMFCLNPRLRYVGWYNHDLKRGMINVADRTEARGTKFFTWGNSDDGDIWEQMLTDEDGPYAEMQSGRLPTMGIWEILSPYSEERWSETWYPVRDIGAPSYADERLAFTMQPAAASVKLGIQAVERLLGARLSLLSGENKIWEQQVDLEPAVPYLVEAPLGGAKADNLVLHIHNAKGGLLAGNSRSESEPDPEYRGTVKIRADREGPRAEDQWLNGIDFEKLGDYQQARAAYRRALQDDPGFGPAEVALGVLSMRQGKLSGAAAAFQKVLKREPDDETARFHLGVCRIQEQRFHEAVEELKYLLRSRLYRAGASYLLGGLYLGLGRLAEAREQLEKSESQFLWNGEAKALLAGTLRRLGEAEAAAEMLERILSADPLNFPALCESLFLARSENRKEAAARRRLEEALRDEVQSYLETASEYARFGLYREAYDILSLYNEGASPNRKAYPMVDYFLGYYAEKIDSKNSAGHFRDAGERAPDFVFPHRLEAEGLLERAIEVNPADWKARYYLGNLLCAKGRPAEALRLWEKAAGKLESFSVIHRNIGRVYWKEREQPDAAILAYRKALAADPQDYKLYFELNSILLDCGLEEQRRELIEAIPEALLENDVIAEMVAAFHTDRQEWDQALALLTSSHFYPWEIYKGVRMLYVDANIGKGISLTRRKKLEEAISAFEMVFEYPRNIGVGEPFYKANAEAHYRIGLALLASRDETAAAEAWSKAAAEPRPSISDLCYYRARALQRLGKGEEAEAALKELLEEAQQGVGQKSGDVAQFMYLSGLAHKGLGQAVQAQQDFHIALALDRAHRRCRWQVSGFSGD